MAEVKKIHLRIFNFCFSVCFALLMMAMIEVTSACILRVWNPSVRGQFDRSKLAVYQNESWGSEYWEEEAAAARVSYESYVAWRQKPFAGSQINIDGEGHRRTQYSQCDGATRTIWMFGGSTMWGTGSPDWGTIPSNLAKIYGNAGTPVCVINFGQNGWRNTQELIELELELKRRTPHPDLVLFYDGFNDSYSFFQSGEDDVHMNYNVIRDKFERLSNRSMKSSLVDFLLATHTGRLITRSRPVRNLVDGDTGIVASSANGAARDLEVSYLDNLEIVQALSEKYGFQYTFFWQPVLYSGHKQLTSEEQKILMFFRGHLDEQDGEYKAMSTVLQHGVPKHVIDMSDVFDRAANSLYIDCVHVVPAGNALVANRIHEELVKAGWTGENASKVDRHLTPQAQHEGGRT